jgi:pilus assembly protein CpaE
MGPRMPHWEAPLNALLISPNREIAQAFTSLCGQTQAFQVLAELKSYPPLQTLDIRLRQLKPDVVALDVATDFEAASEIIRAALAVQPPVQVVGLHAHNDPQAILAALRLGAAEFLYLPFDAAVMQEAAGRIRRLRAPDPAVQPELGKVVCFASAKPGSGASTLATQVAFALKSVTGQRVLLVDCDLMGGTIGFCLKLNHARSLLDAMEAAEQFTPASWAELTVAHGGVDVLPAPEMPRNQTPDPMRLHEVLAYARLLYDWIVLDLPTVFQRMSLLGITEADEAFVVSTTELASLHLTRKAVNLLLQLGIGKEQFKILLNRTSKKDGLAGSDIEKIFNSPIFAKFPNDYFSLHRVVTLGQPLGGDTELGRAIAGLAAKLAGTAPAEGGKKGALMRPALSES